MKSIYDLSWGETSFPAKLALFLKSQWRFWKKRLSRDRTAWAAAYSALSSTYCSIAGTANKHGEKRKSNVLGLTLWVFTWLPLGGWCYWRMLPLSNKMIKLVGYEGATADQLDIRQSILWIRKEYIEQDVCLDIAESKDGVSSHTRGLICVGRARLRLHQGRLDVAYASIIDALHWAWTCENREPRQASRIYGSCAELNKELISKGMKTRFDTGVLRQRARELAEQTGAKDQLLKQS